MKIHYRKIGDISLNGTAHLTLGAATGFAVAHTLQTDPITTILFVGLGGVTGLVPDIDINGKLSNKITFPHKFGRTLIQTIGIVILLYSYIEQSDMLRWIGIGIGICVFLLASLITQRFMLTLTGIGVLVAGIYLQESWIILLSTYIIIASFIAHRSYTHSLLGVFFFGIIAYLFELRIGIQGVFITCMLGYISHLLADMKMLPFNKRGVKWFLPFSKKEY